MVPLVKTHIYNFTTSKQLQNLWLFHLDLAIGRTKATRSRISMSIASVEVA